MIFLDVDAQAVHDVIHILLTEELLVNFEAATVAEGFVEVSFLRAFELVVDIFVAAFRYILML